MQVRYVFEGRDTPSSAAAKRRLGSAPAAAAAEPDKNESLHAIKRVLRNVMVHEKAVITSWCSRNAAQMRGALESVASLQEQAEGMGKDLTVSHGNLRKAGGKLVENMGELQDAVRVATFVGVAHDTVAQVQATIQVRTNCARYLVSIGT